MTSVPTAPRRSQKTHDKPFIRYWLGVSLVVSLYLVVIILLNSKTLFDQNAVSVAVFPYVNLGSIAKPLSSDNERKFILPEACQKLPQKRGALPESTPKLRSVQTLQDIPPEFVYTTRIEPLEEYKLIVYNHSRIQHPPVPLTNLPTNFTLVCLPDGIVVDTSIVGPFVQDVSSPFYLHQNKKWLASTSQVQRFLLENKPLIIDMPGMGVQLSGWTGFTWNHFSLDTLMRLALVYDALMSNALHWRDAKIIISSGVNGGNPLEEDWSGVDPIIRVVFDKLNLTHRLVPNNGWLAVSNTTVRFERLAMPDVAPYPICGPNDRVIDPVFPRGILRPIQTALGALPTNELKWVVYASRQNAGGRRAVEVHRKALILKTIENVLVELNSPLKLVDWTYDRSNHSANLDVFRHAAVVIGPHGANLWNSAFAPPGGLVVEFTTWEDEFLNKDCRTYAFSLANAAGHSYALVETENFGYENKNLLPNVMQVVEIVKDFLTNKDDNSSPASHITTKTGAMAVDQDYLDYLQTLDPIPDKIHIFFPNKTFVNHSELSIVKHGVLNLVQQNPDWNLTVYDDDDIHRIIQHDGASLLSKEERNVLKTAHIVEQTDVARLILMYTQGGLYVDADHVFNGPLEDVLQDTTRFCMPTAYDDNFMQDIICSAPQNKVFKIAIEGQSRLRMAGKRRGGWLSSHNTYSLGPVLWNEVLAKQVFARKEIAQDEFDSARAAIRATGGVIVTKKNQWCDGFLVKPFKGCKNVSAKPLYDLYNMTKWATQVDARWENDNVAV